MTRRTRRSWTPDQKQAFVDEARRRTAAGETFRHVAETLDIHESTLRLWLGQLCTPSVQPVVVEEEHPTAKAQGSAISLATPDGFLFDGLDFASAVRLWERLR